jgi:tetratricopeptide (TPR) repeat protein
VPTEPQPSEPSTVHDPAAEEARGRVRRRARWLARGLTLAAVATAMLWQGGVSVLAMQVIAGLLGLAWLAAIPAEPHRRPPLRTGWLFIGLGIWAALQCLPLPRGLARWLAPLAVELADGTRAAVGQPAADWVAMALAPGDAALQAALYLLAGVTGLVTSEVLMGSEGRRFLSAITNGLVGVACAVSGLFLAKAVLIPEGIVPAAAGPLIDALSLINNNHMAGITNLGLGVALGYAVNAGSVVRQLSYGLAALFLSLGVLLSGSRGGVAVAAILLMGTLVATPQPPKYMRTHPKDRVASARWRAALIGASVLLAAALFALPVLEQEFGAKTSLEHDGKLQLFRAVPSLLAKAPLLGWSGGGFAVVASRELALESRSDFVENLVLQRAADQGIVGGMAFLAALVWLGWSLHKRTRGVLDPKPYVVTVLGFLAANLFDFSFEIAGGLLPMAVCCACIEFHGRQTQPEREQAEQHRRRGHRQLLAVVAVAWTIAAALLVVAVPGRLTRDVPRQLQSGPIAAQSKLVAERFAYDAQALYLLGHRQQAAGQTQAALRSFDRTLELRPHYARARLFRFALRLEQGLIRQASEDMLWLLNHADSETVQRTLDVCVQSARAEALLVEVMPRVPERSLELGQRLELKRPDIVERVALELRKRYPDKRFGIEVLRAQIYIRVGALPQAKAIAAALLANKDTELDGWLVQGQILSAENKPLLAFHALKTVCDRKSAWLPCTMAIAAILRSDQPSRALEYIRAQATMMRSSPGGAAVWWGSMAEAYRQLGDPEAELDARRNAHNQMPTELGHSLALAATLERQRLFGELAELSDMLLRQHPNHPQVTALSERVIQLAEPVIMAGRKAGLAPAAAATPSADANPPRARTGTEGP